MIIPISLPGSDAVPEWALVELQGKLEGLTEAQVLGHVGTLMVAPNAVSARSLKYSLMHAVIYLNHIMKTRCPSSRSLSQSNILQASQQHYPPSGTQHQDQTFKNCQHSASTVVRATLTLKWHPFLQSGLNQTTRSCLQKPRSSLWVWCVAPSTRHTRARL